VRSPPSPRRNTPRPRRCFNEQAQVAAGRRGVWSPWSHRPGRPGTRWLPALTRPPARPASAASASRIAADHPGLRRAATMRPREQAPGQVSAIPAAGRAADCGGAPRTWVIRSVLRVVHGQDWRQPCPRCRRTAPRNSRSGHQRSGRWKESPRSIAPLRSHGLNTPRIAPLSGVSPAPGAAAGAHKP